ncbi:hydrogen gas-evolving membrane-bound hydrogenase subunit E [Vibrio ordalii]|uniref:hydrogen gas-evolving membrane-bound hydrogenase subunit E n=1 Tax=Vibrio ordalii TaxID=28174 RepID=UPI0002482EB3|nr:hydrogen gas-evolving membrane-bound hydrogenase subunit E [Vibrio ordalii]
MFYWHQDGGAAWQVAWVPGLDINLSFKLDGLSFLFASLITGIGAMIQIYALAYMKEKAARFSFHLYLTLFMLAMLGVVVSDNILLLFIFWELTTITSYLLIGFNHDKPVSRKNALQSLLVTGAGGLALLAGLILLGLMADSYQLSVIIEQADHIATHPWFIPSLILVLLGAFTKSAQFPFHFWLPNAMAAPTPVSAYLHSATMVKAGIYLLARLSPIYASSDLWFYCLITVGAVTALWCTLLAFKQTDLKLMLAYSTNVALGKLTLLLGLGTEVALTAAVLFILAHSFYKAALFMVVGNIDKATGTREREKLGNLKSVLLLSLIAAVIAALSKSGVAPMFGFLSKEYMYKSSVESGIEWITLILLLINSLMVALAIALLYKPFFGQATKESESHPPKAIEQKISLWLPAMALAIASFLIPIFALDWLNQHLVIPAVMAIAPSSVPQAAKLWQGFNIPLALSGITLVLGVVLYLNYATLVTWLARLVKPLPKAEQIFDAVLAYLATLASWQTQMLQQKRSSGYMLLFFAVLALMLLYQPLSLPSTWSSSLSDIHFYEVAIAVAMIASALLCVMTTSRLLSVLSLGMVGFMTTLVFMIYSAPDVAKTLLLVETLMVVFVVLLMRHMPYLSTVVRHSVPRRTLNAVIASVIGASVTLILLNITAHPIDTTLSDYFAQQSVPGGHGRNIVNVILVDFRAFDTLGEVIVVVMASLVAISLLPKRTEQPQKIHSLIFATTAHIVTALMLMFSLYLLLRGHNDPGGGFIGALIAVIGFSLLLFAESPQYVRDRLHFSPLNIALFGILLSFMAGAMSVAVGLPFLTGLWWKEILPLGTPLLFDVGIYLAIIGGVMSMLLRVKEELD